MGDKMRKCLLKFPVLVLFEKSSETRKLFKVKFYFKISLFAGVFCNQLVKKTNYNLLLTASANESCERRLKPLKIYH